VSIVEISSVDRRAAQIRRLLSTAHLADFSNTHTGITNADDFSEVTMSFGFI